MTLKTEKSITARTVLEKVSCFENWAHFRRAVFHQKLQVKVLNKLKQR